MGASTPDIELIVRQLETTADGRRRGKTRLSDVNSWIVNPELAPVPFPTATPRAARPIAVSAPQLGIAAPDPADRLPRRDVPFTASVWWLGAHGGSGESTLEALTPGTRAAGHAWPVSESLVTVHRVIVLARSNIGGLRAAQLAAIEWASGSLGPSVQLLGLALIADAPGRLPKPLRDLEQVVAGGFPHVWHLPWVEGWRFAPPGPGESLPKEFRELFANLSLNSPSTTAHN